MREALQSLLGMSAPDLFDETRKHSRNLALAQWQVAACLLAIEQSRAHSDAGFSSVCQCAEVRWGIAAHTAAEMTRVARVLVTFPHLSAAVRDGYVNWTKVREITRVVTPESEAGWVKFARNHTTREVERRVVKSPRQWKKEQGVPDNAGDGGTGRRQSDVRQEDTTAPSAASGSGREGGQPLRDIGAPADPGESRPEGGQPPLDVEAPADPDEARREGGQPLRDIGAPADPGESRREGRQPPRDVAAPSEQIEAQREEGPRPPEGSTAGCGHSAPARSGGSPVVEEQDLFGSTGDGASREPTMAGPCSETPGDEGLGANRKQVEQPTPAPRDRNGGAVEPKEPQPPAPAPPSGRDCAGGARESSVRRPDPDANREPAPDDTEDAAPEVPPELQRVGLRFLLTGVQQSMFDMAASVLKTRKRSLRRREDVLEEMCRMVLGSVGSSTSSRVRTTLVVYRDPATGSDWVETDRGPLRVAREDLEHMAAEGEVVHVARPETEADLPSEILDRSRTPRVPRQDVQRLLDPTPLAPLQTPPAPGEAPAVLEQPSDSQGASTSLDELRPGKIAFPCGGSDSQGATTSLDEGLPPLPVASEPPSQARFPADLAEQEPPHDPSPFEPPPVAETRASRMGQGARPVPTASDPPLEGRHGTAGGAASPDPGASYPRRPWSRGRRAPIPAAVFRKLWLRCGGRCENPGCGRGGPLHVHHDDAWSDEHHHDPDRMRLLCERCHALLHEDDFATRPDWAAARAWRMARAGPVSPARDEGPPGPRAGQGDCLPRPSSRA